MKMWLLWVLASSLGFALGGRLGVALSQLARQASKACWLGKEASYSSGKMLEKAAVVRANVVSEQRNLKGQGSRAFGGV